MYKCSEKDCKYTSKKFFGICVKCKKGTGEESDEIDSNDKHIILNGKKVKKDSFLTNQKKIISIKEVESSAEDRFSTGFKQLDIVLGGGFQKNSLTLLYGDPGIGKSTLLLQLLNNISKKKLKSIYISGEENDSQLKSRFNRLKLDADFDVSIETNVMNIKENCKDYDFLVIDSINTMYIPESGKIGGVSQIKEVTIELMDFANEHNKTILFIGQVIKDGTLAGPQALNHLVDVVLSFDFLDDDEIYRIITSSKNRFNSIDETAIFKMEEEGLKEISDLSNIFIDEKEDSIGIAKSVIFKGSRPIFIEIESLVVENKSENSLYNPVGIDFKKFLQILAIMQKYLHSFFFQFNIFSNVACGIKLGQNSSHIDLAIIASILSSKQDKDISNYIFLGEVSLSGNIRPFAKEKQVIKHFEQMSLPHEIICHTNGYTHIRDFDKIFEINEDS
jgi:DNA repair protein RadA/Sms